MARRPGYYKEYRAKKKAENEAVAGYKPLFVESLDLKSVTLDDNTKQQVTAKAVHEMGDLINFPPRQEAATQLDEEQKEAIVSEVLDEALVRYHEAVMVDRESALNRFSDILKQKTMAVEEMAFDLEKKATTLEMRATELDQKAIVLLDVVAQPTKPQIAELQAQLLDMQSGLQDQLNNKIEIISQDIASMKQKFDQRVEPLVETISDATVAQPVQHQVAELQPQHSAIQGMLQPVATWLRNHGVMVAVATFLVCNTALLAFWQYSFYLASGYSALVAVATATVMEVALVLQSYLFGATNGLAKVALGCTTVATLLVVAQLLHSGVATRADAGVVQQTESEAINKRITALSGLEANAIASIEAMDAKTYPTKIEAARNALNAPGGYSHQIAELRKELASVRDAGITVAKGQGEALAHQQWLLLILNIVLAHVLGASLRVTSAKGS